MTRPTPTPTTAPRWNGTATTGAWNAERDSDLLLDELLAEIPSETDPLLVEMLEQQPASVAWGTELLTDGITGSSTRERAHDNKPPTLEAANPRRLYPPAPTSHSKAKVSLWEE